LYLLPRAARRSVTRLPGELNQAQGSSNELPQAEAGSRLPTTHSFL
jgi:hypothetical protein